MSWLIGVIGWIVLLVLTCMFFAGASANDPNKDN